LRRLLAEKQRAAAGAPYELSVESGILNSVNLRSWKAPSVPDVSHRPHLLFVVWGFPPCRGSGVYRALATANGFAENGWDVTVLTCEREVFFRYTGADPALEPLVDPRVKVVRIRFDWPALDPDVSHYSAVRALAPRIWAKTRVRRDQVPFPERGYGPWRAQLEKAAERIHQERAVDLTVYTANPNVTGTAAWYLHSRHGVPYVIDYRDAWSLNVFTGARVVKANSRAGRWERRLMESAREAWFVNEPLRAWHAEVYPSTADRMHVVSNGYDAEFAPAAAGTAPTGEAGLTFGYLGTVAGQVPLVPFVEGWRLARERSELMARSRAEFHGYLGHYQAPNPVMQSAIESAADVGVSYAGPVSKTRVREVYARFDVCLLVLGTGRYVTSGKVFEYLPTGLPVVSVHDPGNAASDVLREYPMWFPVAAWTAEGIADALILAAEAAVAVTPDQREAAVAFAESFRRDKQLQPRVRALLEGLGLPAGSAAPADGRGGAADGRAEASDGRAEPADGRAEPAEDRAEASGEPHAGTGAPPVPPAASAETVVTP